MGDTTFGSTGVVRVRKAFDSDVADAITDQIWDAFKYSHGIDRQQPTTWTRPFQKRSLDQTATSALFDEILTDRLAVAVDDLVGPGRWDWPSTWGDFLITFPNTPEWELPTDGWHQDWTFDTDADPPRWAKAFVFLNHVAAGGGGTLVVTGSHLLHGKYGSGRVEDSQRTKGTQRLYVECEYLRDLTAHGDPITRRRRFLDAPETVGDVALQVVELTGDPGDVVFIHPWLVHAVAPNSGPGPRLMRAPVFGKAET